MLRNILGFTALALSSTAGAFSQTSAVFAGAGYSTPEPPQVAPGQVLTLFFRGISLLPGGQPRTGSAEAPFPTLLAGLSAQVIQEQSLWNVPISQVSQQNTCDPGVTGPPCVLTSIRVQIPYEVGADVSRDPETGTIAFAPRARLNIYAETDMVATATIQPVPDNAHVFTTCDLAGDAPDRTVCGRIAFHADGTPLNAAAPAAKSGVIRVLLYGLGQTSPPATTGAGALPGYAVSDVLGQPRVVASFTPFVNSIATAPRSGYSTGPEQVPAPIQSAVLQAGSVGIYSVDITAPASLSPAIECGGAVRSNYILTVITSQGADRIPVCIAK